LESRLCTAKIAAAARLAALRKLFAAHSTAGSDSRIFLLLCERADCHGLEQDALNRDFERQIAARWLRPAQIILRAHDCEAYF
jgi:hypothetical protein